MSSEYLKSLSQIRRPGTCNLNGSWTVDTSAAAMSEGTGVFGAWSLCWNIIWCQPISFLKKWKAICYVIFCAYNGICIIYKGTGQQRIPNINDIIDSGCVLVPNFSHLPACSTNITSFLNFVFIISCFLKIVDYKVGIPKQSCLAFFVFCYE